MSVTLSFDANNSAVIYSPFNWALISGIMKTLSPGAYFRTIFSGTSMSLVFDTTPNDPTEIPQLWVRVDCGPWVLHSLPASGTDAVMAVVTGLVSRKHLLEVIVKSRNPNTDNWITPINIVQFKGFIADSGAALTLPLRKSKNIIVYGDSMTEGDLTPGSEGGDGSGRAVEICDILGCWSYAVCTGLDAEFGIIGNGGSGVTLTTPGNVPPFPTSYNQMWNGVARSFNSPTPDLCIILEGFNDHGANVQTGVTTVLEGLIASAPAVKILVLTPFDQFYSPTDHANHISQLNAAVATVANPNVTRGDVTAQYDVADTADTIHPYAYQSNAMIGPAVLALASSILFGGTTVIQRSYSFS